ncbi:protein translocase subunit SecDF [Sinomicrobium weinanense]|uniref:Multifunctional fusion protein n=1 Tax=Sinomicrobium weinanense TaxID=2842200 RepID=A0A926JSS9_9FLAO|nr:protein translocase subunit SecDF [Sinomicrobium weinanense]MBC9796608.1 protein translocase subunit SecDF [Sinomicrobium weinanense]MBU3123592.1 protein translocase subunit SecDF [Sinomicrobium weinanense]
MQNKGLIKLFAILFGIVSIYQLSFTFVTNKVEDSAKTFAINKIPEGTENYVAKRETEETRYLDSIGNETVFDIGVTSFTYNEAKDKELNKGLDLKGGINVILEISVKDIIKGLANNSKDPVFNKALANADKASKNSDKPYVDLFFQEFEAIKGDAKLASPDIFANKILSEEINFQMSDNEVKPVIRRKVDESIVSAFEVLRKRIDRFGVTQPNIQRLGTTGRILVELPGAKDIGRVQKLLQSTAQLEFWETFKNEEVMQYLFQVNQRLKDIVKTSEKKDEAAKPEDASEIDSLLADAEQDSLEAVSQANPLFDLAVAPGGQGGPVLMSFATKDTAQVNDYLKMHEIKQLLPAELQNVRFAWSKPGINEEVIDLYALKSNRENQPPLSGGVVVDAQQTYDQRGNPAVSMQMDGKGAKIWEELTGKAYRQGSFIAIVLDNIVYSAPGVTSGPISGGSSEITGQFSLNEAIDLANVLRAGKLPASADIIQSEVVGPSLGQEAINSGMMSFIIAMILVLLWMLFYYGRAGWFSDVALTFNIVLIFGVLAGLGAVLTLPGIAGIVLTIGMSVDANVLIFERVKEELLKGKGQKQAVADGFGNALSSILDANITTGLTALILFIFGTGPIQGFATTLMIGIATSLFTAIFITRLLVDWYIGRKKSLQFSTPITKNLFRNINVDFLSKRKMSYTISGILIIIALGSLLTMGLNQGVDFVGGRSYQIRFEHPVNPTELASELEDALGSVEVKTFGAANQVKVTTKYKVDEEGTEVDEEIQNILYTSLQKHLPEGLTESEFVTGGDSKQYGIMQSIKVGPTIADDIKRNALWAIVGSLVIVFLYILLRFRKWQFSTGAVAAVFHDVLVVLGVFSLTYKFMPFNMEIDQAFIAAILTVIGYSLNDTVVVFDRIREITSERGWEAGKNINLAINSTLSRTLNTSLTTLVVLLAIFIFGGESIRGFMFALIIGVIVGTYSSVFIATPIMFDTLKNKGADILKKKEKEEEAEVEG